VQSFVAALQLGLKARFGGKVDHLNITVSDEPLPGTNERASYLVLYDTVPGGTGYLHTLLADPQNLINTLKLARDTMASCACQETPDLDGCYNCLYAYKNSYGMENTSRRTALEMLGDILDENVELEKISHLGKINKNVWADSELERRFPEAIQALNQHTSLNGIRIRTTKDIINGKVGFKLEIGDLIYSVEPHVRLGKEQGVAYPCEPDFFITLDRQSESEIRVAVFLDGYRYHKDIVHEDLMKRQGIFLSSNILVWNLTWHDVNAVFAGNEAKIPNVFRDNCDNASSAFIRKISEAKGLIDHHQIVELRPMMMLLRFLSNPDVDKWRGYAMLRSLCWLDKAVMQDDTYKQTQINGFHTESATWPSQFIDQFPDEGFVFADCKTIESNAFTMKTWIAGGKQAIINLDPHSLVLSTIFDPIQSDDEITQRNWQKLLQIINMGQFLPLFFAGTRQGIVNGSFSQLEWGVKSEPIEASEWDKIVSLADEEVENLLSQLAEKNIPVPEVGYELVNNKGASIAEAELAWEDCKVVVLLDYQYEESGVVFEQQGWHVFTLKDKINQPLDDLFEAIERSSY
jgi:DEAD/DEAH box helicase domain-containing protein